MSAARSCRSSISLRWRAQSALQHQLGQQHKSQRLKETDQNDKEDWLYAGDCSGPDCTVLNTAHGNGYMKKQRPPSM